LPDLYTGEPNVDKIRNFPPGTSEAIEKTFEGSRQSPGLEMGGSSSVESLIGHNQDLASRLNVAIGKNIELEKTLSRFKKVHSQYEGKFQAAKDHVAIYKEKEKFLQNESRVLKEKIRLAQAYLSQERKAFEKEKLELGQELYAIKPMAAEYQKLKKRFENEYLPEKSLVDEKLSEAEAAVESLEDDKNSLLKKLAEASEHIQKIAKEFKDEKSRSEQDHNLKIATLKNKLDDVQSENIVLDDRNRTLRKEQIERTELLNRIEEIKKEKEMNIYAAKDEKEDLLLQLNKLKQENDRVKIENHSLKKQWAKTQTEYRDFKSQNASASDEATSLRALWQEKANEHNQIGLLNDSLKTQITGLEKKISLVADMKESTEQRLEFFFSQLENIKAKQDESTKKATEAMENAFKKAIEPLSDFDYNL